MWDEIKTEFSAVTKRRYHSDDNIDREYKERILKDNLRQFLAAILEAH
jgi:hypothetical protein